MVLFLPGLSLPIDTLHAGKPSASITTEPHASISTYLGAKFSQGVCGNVGEEKADLGWLRKGAAGLDCLCQSFPAGSRHCQGGSQPAACESWNVWDSDNPERDLGPLGALEPLPGDLLSGVKATNHLPAAWC